MREEEEEEEEEEVVSEEAEESRVAIVEVKSRRYKRAAVRVDRRCECMSKEESVEEPEGGGSDACAFPR